MAAPGDREHPYPQHLLDYAAKHLIYPRSIIELAEWVKAEYPASTEAVLPGLRKIFRERLKKPRA